MKAIWSPPGDQRGTAICRPWSGPGVCSGASTGARPAVCQRLGIELRDPPVVFPGGRRGGVSELPGVGRPVIFIHMKGGRRDLTEFTGGGFDGSNALDLEPFDADHSGRRFHRCQGPGRTGGAFDVQASYVQAVRRKGQGGDTAMQMGQSPGRSAGGVWCGKIDVRLARCAGIAI